MKSNARTRTHRQEVAALACLLTLGLAACEPGPSAGNAGTDVERVMEQDARARERLAEITDKDGKRDSGEATPAAARTPNDIALSATVTTALKADPDLKVLAIEVNADNGAVTLYGTADSAARRDKATQVTLNVDGVKSVTNHLIILKGS